jgi:hypothetical protein
MLIVDNLFNNTYLFEIKFVVDPQSNNTLAVLPVDVNTLNVNNFECNELLIQFNLQLFNLQ